MAGSDQSVNLGGMLSGISNTIGGMSAAGKGYNEGFIQAFKPEIDPGSPESLQAAAEWASRNGRKDEAAAYRKEANAVGLANTKADLAKKTQDLNVEISKATEKMSNAEALGDPQGVATARKELAALMADPAATKETQEIIRTALKGASGMAKGAASNEAFNKATQAMKLSAQLEDPMWREQLAKNNGVQAVDQLDGVLSNILKDPKVLEAYNAQVAQQTAAEVAQAEESNRVAMAKEEKEVQKLQNERDYEGVIEFARSAKYPSVVAPYVDLAKSLEDLKNKKADVGATYDFHISDSKAMAEKLTRYDTPEFDSGASTFLASIERIESDKLMSKDQKSAQLAKLRVQMFSTDRELSKESLGLAQKNESDLKSSERTIAKSRPSKQEISDFAVQQGDARDLTSVEGFTSAVGGVVGIGALDETTKIEMWRDVQRHNLSMPTAKYVVEDGRIKFDESGQPLTLDPEADDYTYRPYTAIGNDLEASVGKQKERLSVNQQEWNVLKASGANMDDYKLTN